MHSYEKSRVIFVKANTGGEATESARDLRGQLGWYTGRRGVESAQHLGVICGMWCISYQRISEPTLRPHSRYGAMGYIAYRPCCC